MKNKGAISIFALLSMMFFLIFIMVAYNNVAQKGKTQVAAEGVLVDYYKKSQTAQDIYNARNIGGSVISTNKALLRGSTQQSSVTAANKNHYIYSNGKIYKIQ